MPTPTFVSATIPTKQFDQPQHRFDKRVDSRSESKSNRENNLSYDKNLGPPEYLGSTFYHVPNAPTRPYIPPPRNPSIPRPYPVATANEFQNSPLLNNRSPNGSILGRVGKRIVDRSHVPFQLQNEPLGLNNPTRVLNDEWTACWDKEADAIYYYNKLTGEATWLPPDV
jgi:hypothetical protein